MELRARVNQKLYFARLTLDQAQAATCANTRAALLQAALFHLVTAYRLYLGEIAAAYRHPLDRTDSASAAQQAWVQDGRHCPELSELATLEQRGDWPARLLAAYAAAAEVAGTAVSAAPASAGIALVDITGAVELDECRSWLAALQALLAQQRERLQEW